MGKVKAVYDDIKLMNKGVDSIKLLKTKNKVLNYLKNKNDDWVVLQDLVKDLNLNEKNIIKILYKLEQDGIIVDKSYDIDGAPKFYIFSIEDRRLL